MKILHSIPYTASFPKTGVKLLVVSPIKLPYKNLFANLLFTIS